MVDTSGGFKKSRVFAGRKFAIPDERDKGLLLAGIFSVSVGASYSPWLVSSVAAKQFVATTQYVPLAWFAALWMAAGLFCVVAAFVKPDIGGFAVAPFMPAFWGCTYALAWFTGHSPRGWLSAVIFWVVGLYIYQNAKLVDPRPVVRGVRHES